MSTLTTNWPNEFSDLKKLDDILQCPICYEYISTCMITSCSHNFCSVCIRKYLQYKTQCPTCSEETYGSDLRKNRPLDEIITIYTSVKEQLLYKLRLINVTQSIKGSQTDPNICNDFSRTPTNKESDASGIKETPKSEKPRKGVVQKLFSEKNGKQPPEPLVISGVTIPTIFQPHRSPKKNMCTKTSETGPCPVCSVDVPLKNMNNHLDFCLRAAQPPLKKPKPVAEKRQPLGKLVYNMLKDREIKKYLKEHGLNTNGDRKSMIWRMNRYMVLYNAECDCENPRPVAEILKQVEREEREEKANPLFQPPKQKVVIDKKADPETIDKARKEYLQVNKDHFQSLIEAMRQRDGRNIKPLRPTNRIDSDEEEKPLSKPAFDFQMPSTSKAAVLGTISVYSQETMADSDSDCDLFEKSPVKVEADVHQIDWNKTKVKEDSTQEGTSQGESVNEKKMDLSIIDEDSNSYESVFDKSARSEASLTPIGKVHSLSARKKCKTPSTPADISPSSNKMEKMVDEIFEKNSDATSNLSGDDSAIEEDEDDESDDEEIFQFKTPVKNYDMSPELSPMKTRSKRKSAPSTDESKQLTRSARRKRVKRSVSPCY